MEAGYGCWGFLGTFCGNAFFDRHVCMGESRPSCRQVRRPVFAGSGPGSKYVPCVVVVSHLRARHCRRQPCHQTKTRFRTHRSRLWRNGDSQGSLCLYLASSLVLGSCSRSGLFRSECLLLVRFYERRRIPFYLVFHWTVPACEWLAHPCCGHL